MDKAPGSNSGPIQKEWSISTGLQEGCKLFTPSNPHTPEPQESTPWPSCTTISVFTLLVAMKLYNSIVVANESVKNDKMMSIYTFYNQ